MNLRNVKKVLMTFLAVFALLMMAMAFTHTAAFGYAAIGVVCIYGLLISRFWRCTRCGKNLGPLWIKHCPHCGEVIAEPK